MGMYDTLIINLDLLPITEAEKEILKDSSFATKDFENVLTEIYITDDGFLKINNYELESTPEDEKPFPYAEGIRGLMGCLRRKNEHLETIHHHGYVNFGAYENNTIYDFRAKFTDGKLILIERI